MKKLFILKYFKKFNKGSVKFIHKNVGITANIKKDPINGKVEYVHEWEAKCR